MWLSALQIRLLRWLYLDRLQTPETLAPGSSYRALMSQFPERPSSLSRSMRRLERKGLVVIERSAAGQAQRVQLTVAGYQQVAQYATDGFFPDEDARAC
jgi:DNA-binding MarR family transcriptional regulator